MKLEMTVELAKLQGRSQLSSMLKLKVPILWILSVIVSVYLLEWNILIPTYFDVSFYTISKLLTNIYIYIYIIVILTLTNELYKEVWKEILINLSK